MDIIDDFLLSVATALHKEISNGTWTATLTIGDDIYNGQGQTLFLAEQDMLRKVPEPQLNSCRYCGSKEIAYCVKSISLNVSIDSDGLWNNNNSLFDDIAQEEKVMFAACTECYACGPVVDYRGNYMPAKYRAAHKWNNPSQPKQKPDDFSVVIVFARKQFNQKKHPCMWVLFVYSVA